LTDSLPTGRALAIAAALLAAGEAAAQPAEQFFARKTVTITIGYTAGGSYDLYGRMVARHLGKHIAGQPTLIAQNMPGAGSPRPRTISTSRAWTERRSASS
jgi:tripartite-type tricarboxylate transporter receptor subunit TctC